MKKDDEPPFSYLVKVGHISVNPVEVTLSANDKERAGLAELWSVLEVNALAATFTVQRWKRDGVRLKGRVTADIVQACVVTLDPVEAHIDEPVETVFVPEGSKLARMPIATETGEMLLDPNGPDAPEIFTGDTIDAGAVAAEYAALAIEPYPRKPDIAFSGHIESSDKEDKKPSPFAVLKDWKKD
ncbi:YceD family protein [Shinella sp. M31]|uniref:YceD family protein n=1 Tax=Shinella sp. M31 TaxID=3368615 RepID=UPI003BA1EBAF